MELFKIEPREGQKQANVRSQFAERVRNHRLFLGLSIREAAALANISPATLSRAESGHTPDLVTFRELIVWAGVDPKWALIDGQRPHTSSVRQEFVIRLVPTGKYWVDSTDVASFGSKSNAAGFSTYSQASSAASAMLMQSLGYLKKSPPQ